MKRTLNSIMLFLLLFIGQNAWGQSETTINSGSFNDGSITWTLSTVNGSTSNLHLNIEGAGDMPEFSRYNLCPWDDYASYIKTVTISDDITKISGGAFFGSSITSIDIPTKCTEIGARAFYKSKLKEIYIPASVTTIGANAFDYCSSLSLIHYDSSCTSSTGIVFTGVASKGKFIQKGTSSYAQIPSGWERYSHADQCHNGAWVATCGTKLFFYAQKSGAGVNYASSETLNSSESDKERYHPWRTGCYRWTSLEINKNIASIGAKEFIGYENEDVAKMGYTSMQTITVENGNQDFVVGADGALYDKAKTKVYLYPAKNSATEIEVPATVTDIRAGAFYGASNLQSITFLGTIKYIRAYAFAQASSLNHLYFATETAPTTTIASAFTGVASKGIVEADAQTDAFNTFTTSKVGENWEFYGGAVRAYISDGTLYVVGKGEYDTYYEFASWYSDCSSITKIVVGEGITRIGNYAFSGCSNVTEVTLNNSGSIGHSAFSGCTALTRVNLGTGALTFNINYDFNEYYAITNSYFPFKECSKLEYINIADFASFNNMGGLNYLLDSFYGTKAAKTLMINGTAHGSTSELVLPGGITTINDYSLKYFKNVTKVKIPSNVKEINSCFKGDTYLTEITVPATVTTVSDNAFNGCASLQTVTLNNSGTIQPSTFAGCSALTRVNIGTGTLKFVENFDFNEYNAITNSYYPFKGCSKLEYINIADFASFNNIEGLYLLTDSQYGTKAAKTLMINGTAHGSTSELVLPGGITTINDYSLKYFKNVTKVKIPSNVKEINSCFKGDTYLTEITVPATVTTVSDNAFNGCASLQTVTLNNSGTIQPSTFAGCSALTRVNIGTGTLKFVENFDFNEYNAITNSYYPFKGCSKLEYINIADFASFNNIQGLEYLTDSKYGTKAAKTLLVKGVTYNADNTLYIPEGIASYNSYALRYFSNVKKVCLPSTMTTVSGFKNHSYLTNVTLPSSVTSVENNAFYGCSALERIVCPAINVPSATGAIASNPSAITLRVADDSYSDYKAARYWKDFNIERGDWNSVAGVYTFKTLQSSDFNSKVSGKVVSWTSSDTEIFTVNNGVVSSCDFKYDGTTASPYRSASIYAITENADTYKFSVRVKPREVVLTDGNAYNNTVDFEAEKISYTRTYKSTVVGKWQAFYVPFDIEITDELLQDYDFAKLYMVSYQDANNNGVIEDGEPLRMIFNKFSVGRTLHANMPYVVRVKSAGTKTIIVNNTALKAAANGSVNCCTTEHEYTLVGIYEPTLMQGRYGMSVNGTFTRITSSTTKLGANRWYMEINSRTGSGAEMENYARPIEILIEGEDETTGIVSLEDKASDSKNDKIYTLDGRQVTDFETLPSGIYIVNGKKVYKK